jgi:hypothetical protein
LLDAKKFVFTSRLKVEFVFQIFAFYTMFGQDTLVSTTAEVNVSTSISTATTGNMVASTQPLVFNPTPAAAAVLGGPATSLTTAVPGSMVSVLPSYSQKMQTLQAALQAVQLSHGDLLNTSVPQDVLQVTIFSPGMAVPGPFNLASMFQVLPGLGVSQQPGLPQVGMDVSSLASVFSRMALEHSTLLKSKRERDIDVEVFLYSNTMSKPAVEHNMRLSDSVENIM